MPILQSPTAKRMLIDYFFLWKSAIYPWIKLPFDAEIAEKFLKGIQYLCFTYVLPGSKATQKNSKNLFKSPPFLTFDIDELGLLGWVFRKFEFQVAYSIVNLAIDQFEEYNSPLKPNFMFFADFFENLYFNSAFLRRTQK